MKYYLILVLINVYWGLTQVLMKYSLVYMDYRSYVMLRFMSAGLIYCFLFKSRLKKLSEKTILRGCVLGVLLFFQTLLNTFALYYTSAANSVFITQLSIVIVPVYYLLVFRKKPDRSFKYSALGVLIGLFIFSGFLKDGFNFGDFISFISMILMSAQIILGDNFLKNESSIDLAIIQILGASILGFIFGVRHYNSIQWNHNSIGIIILTGVIGTGVANALRIIAQSKIEPSSLILISVLHPIFTLIGSAIIPDKYGELALVSFSQMVGTFVIVISLVVFFLSHRNTIRRKNEISL